MSRAGAPERIADGLARAMARPAPAVAIVFLLLMSVVSYRPPADPDLFARVAVGRLVEINGGVVHQDPFGYTPRLDRWVDHEWLAGVVFYRVAQLGGDQALFVLTVLFMAATVALVGRAQWEARGGRDWNPVWLALTVVPTMGVWVSVVRSRVFTFLFLALSFLALVRWREGRSRWIWLVPVLFVPWANAHGGFVAGLGLLGVAAASVTVTEGRRSLPLWGCLGLCVLATLINPYGLEYWRYILGATTMNRATITEWAALDVTSVFGAYIFVCLGVVVIGSLVQGERRPHPEGIAMIAVALAATLSSQRIMNFLFVLLAIYGAGSAKVFGEWIATRTPRYTTALRRVFAVSFSVGILFAAVNVVQNVGRVGREGLSYDTHPVSAVDWLSTMGNGGRLLVYLNEGSFALWRLFPEYRVSMDGRYEETYPQETLDLVVSALLPNHPDHTKSLRSVAPDYILVQDTARAGAFGSDWNAVYRDDEFVVLAHDTLTHGGTPRPVRPMWRPGF